MLQNRVNWDVIVIGAGALGTFHALFALQKGLKVLMLEKDLRPSEATVRNFGQVIPSGMSEDEWFEHGRISLETYLQIQKEFDISVRQNGSTYLASCQDEFTVLTEKAERYKKLGYACQVLSPEECLQRIPALKKGYCEGGLLFPEEASIEPSLMIYRLHEYLIAKFDLDYRPCTPVKECEVKDGICQVTDSLGNRYHAAKVFICNGRDFKFLMPELFMKSDLELVKLQMMSTYPMPELKLPGSVLSGLSIRRYYAFKNCASYSKLKPEQIDPEVTKAGIHILFKQAVDGSVIIGDSHEYADVSTADILDFSNEDEVNQLILKEARKILDLPSWNIRRTWNGYYSQSKSREIFQADIEGKIQIVTGIGGKGMTTSCGFAKKNIQKIFG